VVCNLVGDTIASHRIASHRINPPVSALHFHDVGQ
jgi:hypothetical protein